MTRSEVYNALLEAITSETSIPPAEIEGDQTFFELGLDSVTSIFVMEHLENQLHLHLNPIDFWDYPTVALYAGRLYELCTNGSQ